MEFVEAYRTLPEIFAKAYDLSKDDADWKERSSFVAEEFMKVSFGSGRLDVQAQNRAIWAAFVERYPRTPNPDC